LLTVNCPATVNEHAGRSCLIFVISGDDANGNTQTNVGSAGTTTYNWDYENRLTSVVLPGSGGTVSFKYDPLGRRIYKSSSSGTSIYAYDIINLIEETNAAGGVVARYSQTEEIDEPLAMLRSSATSYFHADGLGSTTSLSNSAGSLVQTYTFDSFGNTTASTGSLTNSFRYTAREFDTETGLYFYRARYFDPQAGRLLSEDPAAFDAGNNFYANVGNDPTTAVDPSGMAECYYSVQGHVMLCWSNKGGKPLQLGPNGVSSGADKGEQKCKDNPACENAKDLGPITPGRYKMNLDTRDTSEQPGGHNHGAAGQYRLEPWPHHFWDGWLFRHGYTRGGFELHKGTITFGCINADKNNPDAVNQYNQLQQLLQSEDGSNFLNVF
jgi:RHS repeat-associated protein